MPTLIVNSNRIDLIDPVSGMNKSITIDEVSHKAIIDDGGQINELANQSSVDVLATALNNLSTAIGSLASLTTEAKIDLVSAINEVDSNADSASSGVTSLTTRVNASASQLHGHVVLATSDFVANSDTATGTEFPYKAVVTVGSLTGDKSATTFSCQTFFDSESVIAENFASFSNCVAYYDSGTATTSFANTIFAREPMVVDVTSVVTFTTNVY